MESYTLSWLSRRRLVSNEVFERLYWVYKPVARGASCKLLKNEDLHLERLRMLNSAPVLFQKLHVGADIRVWILNGNVLCAIEIESDALDYGGNEKALQVVDVTEHVKPCV